MEYNKTDDYASSISSNFLENVLGIVTRPSSLVPYTALYAADGASLFLRRCKKNQTPSPAMNKKRKTTPTTTPSSGCLRLELLFAAADGDAEADAGALVDEAVAFALPVWM